MKYFPKHLLFCTAIMLVSFSLYAQLSQRVITITRPTMDIPGLAKTIAAQTGVEYSLNMQNTSLKKYVQLKPGKWKLEDVMKAVQEQAGLNYKIIGDHILFTDYKHVKKDTVISAKPAKVPLAKIVPPKVIQPAPKAVHTQRSTTRHKKPTTEATVTPPESEPTPGSTSYHLSPLPLQTGWLLGQPGLNTKLEKLTITAAKESLLKGTTTKENIATKGDAKAVKTSKERKHFTFPPLGDLPLAEVGITANDIVYLSASAKAGIQYIYGIGTLGVSSGGMRFRYGAGLRIPLNESAAIHAEFTTGGLSRISTDSTTKKTLLRERLNAYGLSWSKTIRPRLNLQLELNYSTLKKSSDSTLTIKNNEINYYKYGKPLYNARIAANGNDYVLNSWVGLRISLFYNLRRNNW
ncbi:hypothetical protein [Chitinophaga sp.]|uniref:hypothetical protein n=1 Tax=Chitinophaga sp. TaxID=1869181 RepID=UPI0031DEF3ED